MVPLGEERRTWGGGASQPAPTRTREDVASSSTAAGSQAYLAVMAHAEETAQHAAALVLADSPEEDLDEEDKPGEADWGVPAADVMSEITAGNDEQDTVPAENEDEVPAENEAEVPAENELPILCRCRADLQDGRHAILSSSQTLEEWQALSSCRANVEQKLRDAGGAS